MVNAATKLICPRCHGADVKRLSLVFHEGLSALNTTTAAIGAGVSRSPAGVGVARTTGSSQTALSVSASPPQRKNIIGPTALCGLAGLVALASISTASFATVIWIAVFLAAAYAVRQRIIHNTKIFPSLLTDWENTFHCNRCAERFIAVL